MINPFKKRVKLVTHDKQFHADDVFATACLKIYFRKNDDRGVKIIRSRDPKLIERMKKQKETIVYDVGGKYDSEQNFFDHHQGGIKPRQDGVPYSAFGLIWKHYGMNLVTNSEIHQEIDKTFVEQICATDVAYVDFKIEGTDWDAWTFDDVVKLFRPRDDSEFDNIFEKLVSVAEQILEKIIQKKEKQFADSAEVEKIYQKSEDKKIIILDQPRSWKKVLSQKEEPLYVIFASKGGNRFNIQAVPVNEQTYENRKPFPVSWRGKSGKDLEKVTGIDGVIFCHASGYLAATDNLEDAKKFAQISLDSD